MPRKKKDPEKFMKSLGLKIRAMRAERGWTLEDTEEFGYPSWRHLQSVESGKNITVYTLVNIANLFGIHPSELLEGV